MTSNVIPFPTRLARTTEADTLPCRRTVAGVVRINRFEAANHPDAGRIRIAGRMADVCAALDRLAALEACA